MVMAKWVHLFPFRTEKLSTSASMVPTWQRVGRVERRQPKAFFVLFGLSLRAIERSERRGNLADRLRRHRFLAMTD